MRRKWGGLAGGGDIAEALQQITSEPGAAPTKKITFQVWSSHMLKDTATKARFYEVFDHMHPLPMLPVESDPDYDSALEARTEIEAARAKIRLGEQTAWLSGIWKDTPVDDPLRKKIQQQIDKEYEEELQEFSEEGLVGGSPKQYRRSVYLLLSSDVVLLGALTGLSRIAKLS